MPVPVNNAATAGGSGALLLDQRVVSARAASFIRDADEFASDFSSDFVAPINERRTSTVLVRKRIELAMAATPASRDGLLARTGVTDAGSVEVRLTGDEYAKVGIDSLGVDPATHSAEIGEAIGRATVRVSNRSVIDAVQSLTNTLALPALAAGATRTAQEVWTALLDSATRLVTNDINTDDLTMYVAGPTWALLLGNVAVLNGGGDPRERAAELLGISRVRIVGFTDGAGTTPTRAALLHPNVLACARVLSGVGTAREDWDEIVEARIRYGTAVVEQNAAVRITG